MTTNETSSLSAYLRVLRRRWWIVLTCVLLVPATAVLLSVRQTAQYQSTADVYINKQNLASALTGIADQTLWIDEERAADTQANLALVPNVAARALARARVTDRSADDLLAQASVEPKGSSDILEFTVTDPDPEMAQRLATAYAQAFAVYRGKLDTQAIVAAHDEVSDVLTRLEGEGREDTALYESLEDKQQQLQTLETLQTSRASVIRTAPPAVQIAPTPIRNGILALALGLVLGVGLAFVVEALDTRVRHGSEIGGRLGLTLLARIPPPPKRLEKDDELVMIAQPRAQAAEAFRVLRTNLDFTRLERDVRSIVVVSAVEEEGKSTTCANLAIAMTRSGSRVCLVDVDLRRPTQARFFGLQSAQGLTDVVRGVVSLDDALQRIDLATGRAVTGRAPHTEREETGALDVLVAGHLPPDPGELVGTRTLQGILRELRVRYDVVLLDTPPVLRVGDALTLATHTDAVLVVTRLGIVTRPTLDELRRALDGLPVPKLGYVVTGSTKGVGYGSRDAYGYEYGEGYYTRDEADPDENGRAPAPVAGERV